MTNIFTYADWLGIETRDQEDFVDLDIFVDYLYVCKLSNCNISKEAAELFKEIPFDSTSPIVAEIKKYKDELYIMWNMSPCIAFIPAEVRRESDFDINEIAFTAEIEIPKDFKEYVAGHTSNFI